VDTREWTIGVDDSKRRAYIHGGVIKRGDFWSCSHAPRCPYVLSACAKMVLLLLVAIFSIKDNGYAN